MPGFLQLTGYLIPGGGIQPTMWKRLPRVHTVGDQQLTKRFNPVMLGILSFVLGGVLLGLLYIHLAGHAALPIMK